MEETDGAMCTIFEVQETKIFNRKGLDSSRSTGEFLGGPVVKSWGFHCRVHGFRSDQGTKDHIPYSQKEKKISSKHKPR